MPSLKNFSFIFILFLIATEGLFAEYKIVRLIELTFFIYILRYFHEDLNRNKVILTTFNFTILLLLMLCLKLFTITFIYYQVDFDIFISAIRLILMFMVFYTIYFIISKDIKYLNLLLVLNFPILLVAFFQSDLTPLTDFAWDLKFNYFRGPPEDTPWYRTRVNGLYEYAIPLGYVLVTNMIISSYLYKKFGTNIYFYYFIFLGIISAFTLTRSVMLSWGIVFIYMIYLSMKKTNIVKKSMFILTLFAIISYGANVYIENTDSFDRLSSTSDQSAQGRLPLAITGMYTLIMHPFGLTDKEYKIAKEEMYAIYQNKNILDFASHNGLLNLGFVYTFIGLLSFFLYILYVMILTRDRFDKDNKIFFTVAVFAYLGNAMFHNNFIFYMDFYGFILLAILAFEYAESDKQIN